MKILYITPEPPSRYSGGGIVVEQSLKSLKNNCTIDYVGPEILHSSVLEFINKTYYLEKETRILKRIINLLKGQTTSFYECWKRICKVIDWELYDCIYLEFSKFDFAAIQAKNSGKKLILRLHNVERDYSLNLLKKKYSLSNLLKYIYTIRKEKKIVKLADHIIVLTDTDKGRLKRAYSSEMLNKAISTIPVCIDRSKPEFNRSNNKHQIYLITGSLWYGPNYEGIMWFVKNVWVKLNNSGQLLIAGFNPNPDLIKFTKKVSSIRLIPNPVDITNYFKESDIYISPIFDGAGMKVKVAEALSYGLPIIGTSHSYIGYQIKNGKNSFIANTPEEMINAINTYSSMEKKMKVKMKKEAYKLFETQHSMEISVQKLEQILLNK